MCIIRNKAKIKFTQIDNNSLRSPNLSWQAKGLLGHLLSYPDNWTIHLSKLIKEGPDGQFATKSAMKELETAGYLKRERTQDEKGRIKWKKVIYETPNLNPDWQSANPPEVPQEIEWQPKVKVFTPKPVEAEIKKEVQPNVNIKPIEQQAKPIEAESKLEDDKKLQPKERAFKFTKAFSEAEKDAMTSMLQGINKAQQLIEALETMMSRKEINNPVGYLRGIIKKYHDKQFTPVSKEPKTTQPPKGPNGHVYVKPKSWVKEQEEKEAVIDACHFCDNTGHIELKYRDGTKKRMNCMHPAEEKVFNHVRKIDALIVTADPGYKGHRENEEPKKTTVELQQEFVQALQKFGQNNAFGGERLNE